ncbi:MAG TPA: lyase family protein [Acidimicrobiia bacterium]|nr:lyase family protein [Acidimicrobiia bacterium]
MTFPDPGFSTASMAAIFSAERRVAGLLAFEVSLVRAGADLGLVSSEVAEEVAGVCQDFDGDPAAIVASAWDRGSPLIDLLHEIGSRLSAPAGQALHRGATSQDAIDTALMLQIRDAITLLASESDEFSEMLEVLARSHQHTPYMARTLLQDALPSTFGARAAAWLSPVKRAGDELKIARVSLPLQLGGPIGDLALSAGGQELVERVADYLDLRVPNGPWHTDRSYVRRPCMVAVELALAMEKIAFDLALLSSFGEVSMRPGESSTMKHKRNPIDAIRVVAAARACVAAASALSAVGGHELERGAGGWQVEWWAVPLVFQGAAAAVEGAKVCLAHLEVHPPKGIEEP